jgi:dTDP-4-dehydrorhamnose reductase
MPDAIVHLVALTNVDQCETDPKSAYNLNVRALENICSWIRTRHPECKLINISTDQVYDGTHPSAESEIVLRNVYAWSKRCAELVSDSVGGISLRTNFFGKSAVTHRKSFSDWLYQSFSTGQPISLFSDVFFSPLSMKTLSRAIIQVLHSFQPGVYNLGSHDGMSKAEFALKLADLFGFSTDNATVTTSDVSQLAAKRPKDMRMIVTSFEEFFHFPLPTLEEEIKGLRSEYEIQEPVQYRKQNDQQRKPDLLHS